MNLISFNIIRVFHALTVYKIQSMLPCSDEAFESSFYRERHVYENIFGQASSSKCDVHQKKEQRTRNLMCEAARSV